MSFFHGAVRPRRVWDYATLGKGNDQHGPGWYFTSDKGDAYKYAAPDKQNPDPEYPNGGYIHKCRLIIDDEVYGNIVPNEEDGWEERYGDRILKMIQQAPNYEDNMTDWDEDLACATHAAFDAIIDGCSGPFDCLQQLWRDHYFGEEEAWAQKIIELFDWDCGMPPAFANGVQHVVVWNPQVIVMEEMIPYTPSDEE